jgi:hypothetical protein
LLQSFVPGTHWPVHAPPTQAKGQSPVASQASPTQVWITSPAHCLLPGTQVGSLPPPSPPAPPTPAAPPSAISPPAPAIPPVPGAPPSGVDVVPPVPPVVVVVPAFAAPPLVFPPAPEPPLLVPPPPPWLAGGSWLVLPWHTRSVPQV